MPICKKCGRDHAKDNRVGFTITMEEQGPVIRFKIEGVFNYEDDRSKREAMAAQFSRDFREVFQKTTGETRLPKDTYINGQRVDAETFEPIGEDEARARTLDLMQALGILTGAEVAEIRTPADLAAVLDGRLGLGEPKDPKLLN